MDRPVAPPLRPRLPSESVVFSGGEPMFLVPVTLLAALLLAIALPWWIVRLERGLVPLFLVFSTAAGIAIWRFWTHDLTYTVSMSVNDQPTSSFEEPFRTGFKVVLTAVLASILGATAALLAGRLQKRRRRRTSPTAWPE
jgi:hypothetical protein